MVALPSVRVGTPPKGESSLGLVHRDIKPANLFHTRRGPRGDHIKVLDFGLVQPEASAGRAEPIDGRKMTSGTPAYMAPEQGLGHPLDRRADIYLLGCVAYWLLTGDRVFDAETSVEIVVKHIQESPEPVSRRTELEIPEQLETIVMRCLEKEVEKRFPSAQELAAALESVPVERAWTTQRAQEWWDLHLIEPTAT